MLFFDNKGEKILADLLQKQVRAERGGSE